MKFRRGMALFLAALSLSVSLMGCAEEEVQETPSEPAISFRNDGRQAEIVLGELSSGSEKTEVLKEIARKYQADFPDTKITVETFSSPEELQKALKDGRLDIAELDDSALYGCAKDDLLLDLYPYMNTWDESVSLSAAAKQAAGALGQKHAYLIPNSFSQDLLFYRVDWFDEYNEGLETGLALCHTWDHIAGRERDGEFVPGAVQKLGDRGKLAFGGGERLMDYFNAMMWSSIGTTRFADPGAAYFSAADESKSIFSLERAEAAADRFLQIMKDAVLPESLEWTEEQAVAAFQDGRVSMLLADRSVAGTLAASMPEGSWKTAEFPRGGSGMAVFSDSFTGWCVSAAAKDPEITVHFLTFLSNADNNTYYAKTCRTLPIHTQAVDMEESLGEGNLAAEAEMIQRADAYQYASEPRMYRAYEGFREQAEEWVAQTVRGELSRDQLLSKLDEYWSSAYAEEGNLWK